MFENSIFAGLSTFEREELIAMIIHLKNELRKKERWKSNCDAKNGRLRQKDTSMMCDQKLLPAKRKFGKPTSRLRTNNKLVALNSGTQKELRAKIIKIHSDDEGQRTTVSTVKMTESREVATSVKESELNADDCENDDSYASALHGIAVDAKTENVTEKLEHSFSGTESASIQTEENEMAEQRQQAMKVQTKRASGATQRYCENYEDNENRADEYPIVDIRTERFTFERNQDECNETSDDTANSQFTKQDSNNCSELQGSVEEKEPSSDAGQQLEKMTSVKTIEMQEDEIKVENAERIGFKQDEIMPNFVLRSILRITSAHLKRLELLVAKTNFY